MTLHIINGPNLNLLGKREPETYGNATFDSFLETLREKYRAIDLRYFQSNHEGALIDYLHEYGFNTDGFIINAGGYSHTSIALADAIAAIPATTVEVHISNIFAREAFRHHSHLSRVCKGSIVGLGISGYQIAVEWFLLHCNDPEKKMGKI